MADQVGIWAARLGVVVLLGTLVAVMLDSAFAIIREERAMIKPSWLLISFVCVLVCYVTSLVCQRVL